MADFQSWLEAVGFKRNPFERAVADNDDNLSEYFIKFPYYYHVLGQAQHPQTTFLLAERGGGKTANRIQVEQHCHRSIIEQNKYERILGISFIDFAYLLEIDKKLTLRDYVEEILKQAVPKFYDTIFDPEINNEVEYSKLVKNLSPEDRYELIYYLTTYSDRLSTQSLRRDVRKFQQIIPEAKRDVIERATQAAVKGALQLIGEADVPLASTMADSIHSLFELIGREEIQEIKTLKRSPLELIERFCYLVRLFDIQSIYIIVDTIDEYTEANDLETPLKLVKPLLQATRLLGLGDVAFKFFLPAELEREIKQIVRTDRIPIYEAKWSDKDLERLLQNRLAAAARSPIQQVQHLKDISEHRLADIDETLIKYSRSPRDLIRLGAWIFAEHARGPDVSIIIMKHQFRRAVSQYATERFREMELLAGQDRLITNLAEMKLLNFNLDDAIARLNLPEEQALGLLRRCEKEGYVKASYEVIDPHLKTYMTAVLDVDSTTV